MLTYLVILLDDASTSYCHYEVRKQAHNLISIENLRQGIVWAMKENLNIQFVYPDYELPEEYLKAIESIDHTKIMPSANCEEADVIVLNGWDDTVNEGSTCIIRTSREDLAKHMATAKEWLKKVNRLNIVLTDTEAFKDSDIDNYAVLLDELSDCIADMYANNRQVQVNLLTDRLLLTEMNNCNAGDNNITLAPNGCFYLCPAFYFDDKEDCIGNLKDGIDIKNQQLLRLDHAPLCRQCDAYQCKRCIWMNQRLTLDANTPSHQQCVIAHIERNASRNLLAKLKERGIMLRDNHEIKEIDYLDPFNILNRWK